MIVNLKKYFQTISYLSINFLLLLSLAFSLFVLSSKNANAQSLAKHQDKIVMQIRWLHQFQFAGYYAAVHKGFYQDKGLQVEIVAGSPDKQPVTEVLAGRAQYGEANSELLHSYLNGESVVALAAIVQHSPSVLLTRSDSLIRTPQDLVGKNVMMAGKTDDIDFLSMLAYEGVDPLSVKIIPSSYNINDLIDKKIDAFNAYLTNEPFFLKEKGIKPYSIKPVNYGVDFYSDILFTTKKEIETQPKRVKAFIEASLLGWEYALNNKAEIIDLIIKKYAPNKSRQHLEFEADAMESLILPKLIPIGNINPGRFKKMADSLVQFGFAKPGYSLDKFIYDPNPKIDKSTFFRTVAIISVLLFLSLIFASLVWRFNRRLQKEISRAHDAETRLSESEVHHRNIIENLQDVYYRTDNEGLILNVSPSVNEVIGYTREQVIGKPIADYYAPGYSREDFLKTLASAKGKIKNYEIKGIDAKNEFRWLSVNSQYVYQNSQVIGIEGTVRDITEKKHYEQKIIQLANSDSLTGLSNRRALFDNLEKVISFNKRRSKLGGMLYIDLDKFKPVNDIYGHHIGDELLMIVSHQLRSLLRGEDSIYRIGGDEFIILLPDLNSSVQEATEKCQLIAEKIVTMLLTPFEIEHHHIEISASLGGVLLPEGDLSGDELMNKADVAMYQAKDDKNTFFYMAERSQD